MIRVAEHLLSASERKEDKFSFLEKVILKSSHTTPRVIQKKRECSLTMIFGKEKVTFSGFLLKRAEKTPGVIKSLLLRYSSLLSSLFSNFSQVTSSAENSTAARRLSSEPGTVMKFLFCGMNFKTERGKSIIPCPGATMLESFSIIV